MTTMPDLGQSNETCGGVKQVYGDTNPHPTSGQSKKSKITKAATTNIKQKFAQSDQRVPELQKVITKQKCMLKEDTFISNVRSY